MISTTRVIQYLSFVSLVLLTQACGSGQDNFGPPLRARSVNVVPFDQSGTEISQGSISTNTVYVAPRITPRSGETHELSELAQKFEVNFGDGTGWFDVSDYTTVSGTGWPELHNMFTHSYTSPGTYQINARGTYFDGEVVYLSSEHPLRVTVGEVQ